MIRKGLKRQEVKVDTLIDFAKTEAFGIIAITLLFINFVILTYIAIFISILSFIISFYSL